LSTFILGIHLARDRQFCSVVCSLWQPKEAGVTSTSVAAGQMRLLFSSLYKTGSEAPGKDGPVLLSSASELSSIGYFQRRTVAEMMLFFSRQFAKGAKDPGQRSSVKEQGYLCHVYVSPAGVVAACFADEEYPTRVAFGYLSKLCEDFLQATGGNLGAARADGAFDAVFQGAHLKLLTQFQDPAQADQQD